MESFLRLRGKDLGPTVLCFPSPAKRGKVPTAGAGAPANSGAGPEGERQDGASQAEGALLFAVVEEDESERSTSLIEYEHERMNDAARKRHDSAWSLFREGLRAQRGWTPAWRDRDPEPAYDVVIIGGGGHGLATAYYLAKQHGVKRVALLEKGWIGGGNTGRNTTIIRSNYFHPESAALYDLSVSLYEGLARELNYNIMFSQRGLIEIAHSDAELDSLARAANAMRINGIPIELLSREQTLALAPLLDPSPNTRWPVRGALQQRRAGTARHDAVAWGYARAADALGVHIIQNCEVTGFEMAAGRLSAVKTSRGTIRAERFGMAVAVNSSGWRSWPASNCRSRATRCRRWSASRSNPASTSWWSRPPTAITSVNRTRASS